MCYTAQSLTLQALKYALHRGDVHAAEELERELNEILINRDPKFFVSGFAHPELLVFTNLEPKTPKLFTWGLIPSWNKSISEAKKTWNNTLNARGETIFEKTAFKASAFRKRCVIYLDAFYEYHHHAKQTFPYRITSVNNEPLAIAGLWEEWTDKNSGELFQTVSIVTTEANALMKRIHNNPKAEGPRMPVILPKEKQDEWLIDCKTDLDLENLKKLIAPLNEDLLSAYTVGRLSGKEAIENNENAIKEVNYPILDFKETLF